MGSVFAGNSRPLSLSAQVWFRNFAHLRRGAEGAEALGLSQKGSAPFGADRRPYAALAIGCSV